MKIVLFVAILIITLIIYNKDGNKNIEQKTLRFIKYGKRYNSDNNEGKANNLISTLNYVRLIKRKQIKTNTNFTYFDEPKISFISSVYNKENYIDLFIISIQSIDITSFEIIFVDDCSNDKSIKIINNFMKNDKRIKLIKNKKNQGSLYSRSIGAFNSAGKYIIFVDSDDIIIPNGISMAYKHIIKYNLSLVQYNSLIEKKEYISVNKLFERYQNIITQPFLSYIFFFNKTSSDERNSGLWDKIIRKDVVIKSLFFIGKNYLNQNIKIENDVILLFSVLQNSESYHYINNIGYYYIRTHMESISNNWNDPSLAKEIIESILMTVDFLYEKAGNTTFEKKYSIFKLKQSLNRYKDCFKYIKQGDKLIRNLFDKLLNSKYIQAKNKIYIINIETEILFLQGNSTKYLVRNKI